MMIEHSVPPIRNPGFTAEAEQSGRLMTVRLTGNADMSVICGLGEFLMAFQAAAHKEKVTEVRVEMRDLYFMNSSCLRHFVTWLSATSERPSDQQYRVVFLSNPNLRWQARTLDALKHFAEGLVVIA